VLRLKDKSLDSHSTEQVSIPGQSIRKFWWTKRHWESYLSDCHRFPLPVSFRSGSRGAARCKAWWVYGRLLAGIAVSNPAGGMDICLLRLFYIVQVEVSATDRSFVQRRPTDCVCVYLCIIECDQVQQ